MLNTVRKYPLLIILLLCSLLFGQQEQKVNYVPIGLTIIVNDLSVSTEWYKDNLHFKIHKDLPTRNILKRGDFYLELKTVDESLNEKSLKLPEEYKFINGYSKFSFVVDNLNGLYNHLFINGVDVFRQITEGEFFQGKYFVITDPDGNYLQFISNEEKNVKVSQIKMKPFLISKMVGNLDENVDWYTRVLGCTVSEILDIPEHELRLGYLEMNGFYFELIQTGVSINKSKLEQYKNQEIQGFNNLTLLSDDINKSLSLINNADFDINKKLEEANFSNFKKQLNITDPSENNIQIIN